VRRAPGVARENSARARTYTNKPEEIAAIGRLQQGLDRLTANQPAEPREAAEPSQFPSVGGTLESMECGALARLHVRVASEVEVFVIPDPARMAIHGANGETIELPCGPQQPPHALRIEYQALPSMAGVAGLVRTLEFR
jgi:hypothetical protein